MCDSHHHPAHHRLQGDRDGLACMYVCVYMYVRVYVCMYGCICMYACICMYVCMYVTLHTECVLINHISRMREDKTLFTTQQKPAPALLDAAGVPSTAPGRCAAAGELNTKASTSATIVPFHGTGTQTPYFSALPRQSPDLRVRSLLNSTCTMLPGWSLSPECRRLHQSDALRRENSIPRFK